MGQMIDFYHFWLYCCCRWHWFYAVLLLWSHCKLNSSTIDINTSSTDTWYELSLSMGMTAMHCHGISQRLDSGHGTHITHSLKRKS